MLQVWLLVGGVTLAHRLHGGFARFGGSDPCCSRLLSKQNSCLRKGHSMRYNGDPVVYCPTCGDFEAVRIDFGAQ